MLACGLALAAGTSVSAQEPWNEPFALSKMTPVQKQRIEQRKAEIEQIKRWYPVAIDYAVRASAQMMQKDIEVFGQYHDETARGYYRVAETMYRKRNWQLALDVKTDEAKIYAKLHGPDDWRVWSVLNRLRVWKVLARNDRQAQRTAYSNAWDLWTKADNLEANDANAALQTAVQAAQAFAQVLAPLGIEPITNPDLADAFILQSRCLNRLGRYDDAETVLRDALAIIGHEVVEEEDGRKVRVAGWGPNHPAYADALGRLGWTQYLKGEFGQAERTLRQALEIMKKCHEAPHREIADAMADLGAVYQRSRQLALAESMYSAAHDMNEKSDGSYAWLRRNTLQGLAEVYRDQNRDDKAEEQFAAVIKLVEQDPGKDTLAYALALHEHANLLAKQGKNEEALKQYEAAAQIYYRKNGIEHPNYAIVSASRGEMYSRLKRDDEAKSYLEGSLRSLRKTLGDRHASTRSVLGDLENFRQRLALEKLEAGETDAARELFEKLRSLRAEMDGERDWRVVRYESSRDFAEALGKLDEADRKALVASIGQVNDSEQASAAGRHDEAVDLAQKCLEIRSRLLPSPSWFPANARLRLANALLARGRVDQAEPALRKAVDEFVKVCGERLPSPDVAAATRELGILAQRRGDLVAALALYDRAAVHFQQLYGEDNLDHARILVRQAQVAQQRSGLLDAEILLRKALRVFRRRGGIGDPAYVDGLRELGWILQSINERDEVRGMYEEIERLAAGENVPELTRLRIGTQIGLFDMQQGKAPEAARRFRELEARARQVPAFRQDAASLRFRLAQALLAANEKAEAEDLLKQAAAEYPQVGLEPTKVCDAWAGLVEARIRTECAAGAFDKAAAAGEEYLKAVQPALGEKHWLVRRLRGRVAEIRAVAAASETDRAKFVAALAAEDKARDALQAGRTDEAIAAAQAAVEGTAIAGSSGRFALAARRMQADAFERAGKYAEAAKAWDGLLEAAREPGVPHPDTAKLLLEAGEYTLRTGIEPAGKIILPDAREMYATESGRSSVGFGLASCRLAEVLLRLGDMPGARAAIDDAFACLVPLQSEEPAAFAAVVQFEAELHLVLGAEKGALEHARRAYEYTSRYVGTSTPAHARSLLLLAESERRAGDVEAAESFARLALQLVELRYGKNSLPHARCLSTAALVASRKRQWKEADGMLLEAARSVGQVVGAKHVFYAEVLDRRAAIHSVGGDPKDALKMRESALALLKESGGESRLEYLDLLKGTGELALRTGDRKRAAEAFLELVEKTRGHLDRASVFQSEHQQVVLSERLRAALDLHLSVLPEGQGIEEVYARVLDWKGAVLARQSAIRSLRGRPPLAPVFAEWERTVGELAAVATRIPFPEEESFWLRHVEHLTRAKDRLEGRLLQTVAVEKTTAAPDPETLRKSIPPGTALVDFLEFDRYEAPQDPRGAWNVRRELVAFVVRADQPLRRIDLGPVARVAAAVEEWRESNGILRDIAAGAPGGPERFAAAVQQFSAAGAALRRDVWMPLTIHLDGAGTVLLAPDGELAVFPFGALPGTAPGSYLVEEKTFAIATAPRLLPALLAKSAPGATGGAIPDSLLLLGGIDFDAGPERREVALPKLAADTAGFHGATLGSTAGSTVGSSLPQPGAQPMFRLLKETGPEIETIDRMFREQRPDGTSRKFDGRTGTENSFRRFASGSRWIHLATHGFFSDRLLIGSLAVGRGAAARVGGAAPDVRRGEDRLPSAVSRIDLMSGVTLAGANKANAADEDDGILWAMEVAALDLSRTDFAVLSACETGLGKIAGGEGTLGLQRAFQTAGARTVVSTLWNVNDHVTRLLMERIYDNLFRKRMSKAAAVREAQIWMLTASRRSFEEERQVAPGDANHQSTHLPARYMLPASWAPYLLVGDWR